MNATTARTVTRPRRALRHWLHGRRPWWWQHPYRGRFALAVA